ncbi:MAG: hypothetical protein RJB01_333 [Actinomycetota bacterium]
MGPTGQPSMSEPRDDEALQRVLNERFYRFVDPSDLAERSSETLEASVADMRWWAARRVAGETLIRATHDEQLGRTIIDIVTDDMPFLVDSVANQLSADGRTVHLLIHPQLAVQRDEAGELIQVIDADVAHTPDSLHESWMRIELERDYRDDDLQTLMSTLRRVLGDVRKAVTDWVPMRTKALEIAAALRKSPPPGIPSVDVEEAVALLEWLAQDNMAFLGYREYDLIHVDGEDALRPVPGSGLGILRLPEDLDDSVSLSFAILPTAVRAKARDRELLVLTKANSRSTVHRNAYLDYIGIKRFDADGKVIGEQRFLGLYAASAYTHSITDIPILRRKYVDTLRELEYVPESHSAKDLRQFMETYPRDELFQISPQGLISTARAVVGMSDRRQSRVFVRPDIYGRFLSVLVYLPRDRYTTAVRKKVEAILLRTFGGTSVDFTVLISEGMLARIHFVVHVPVEDGLPIFDSDELQAEIALAASSWEDEFAAYAVRTIDRSRARPLVETFDGAFSDSYKADFSPDDGVADALTLSALDAGELSLQMYAPVVSDAREVRFKITSKGEALSLSRVLPLLQSLGVDVLDEYPYEIHPRGDDTAWILDFGLTLPERIRDVDDSFFDRFEDGFRAAWQGRLAVDSFNTLIATAGFTWRECMVIRSYARYMRQIGSTFGQGYLEQAVLSHPDITSHLMDYFRIRFDPGFVGDRDTAETDARARIESLLADVMSLDEDRILRLFMQLISASVRTNFFRSTSDESRLDVLTVKLQPRLIPDIPAPAPMFEIWTYSPRVEGVHLRFGQVARGGLRWSDRREDFRTEILGLVKAQEVKNAVIVPVGAKGGFYPKKLPDPARDRDAWLAGGTAAYREFISSLLEITDNLVNGAVIPPTDVVRHDADDPYLVVAADKGTATFSDIANGISAEFDFWLGDAFASGGSVGYDHKAMGITARGAWESVKRHFRELDIDTQTQPFTVIGIGDMSGDVFGNGMLLSEHIKLVAAFDHRHIFIDPDPDTARTFAERERLFRLPRSSWADFDAALISPGGGVFPRTAKSVPLSAQIRELLDIPETDAAMTPDQLISAILKSPADLLWNGGIGTYVKAQNESNTEVGDKANDAIRVNGGQLRVKVIGEGGNLGLTQKGRIEAARHGVKLNTDAIDNSAGVDTSDHEVNIKILLDAVVRSGELTQDERNQLLAAMTDDVASMVLQDNYDQNVVLGNARRGAPALITVHQRMIREMERRGLLDRALESLPDDEEFTTLIAAGSALTSPELAVLLAYSKIWLTANLNRSNLSSDPWFEAALVNYFPAELQRKFKPHIAEHPLRDRIIDTVVTNQLLNVGGVTFVYRAIEETGANVVQVVRAAVAAMEVFGIRHIWDWVNSLDNTIPTSAQSALQLEVRRLLDRATRWFLQFRGAELNISAEVTAFRENIAAHAGQVPEMLRGNEAERFSRRVERFVDAGAPQDLAQEAAAALDVFALLDITEICNRTGESAETVIPLYFALSDRYDVDRTLIHITELPRGDRWSALARQALRTDLYQVIAALTSRVIAETSADAAALTRIENWEMEHAEGVSRARTTLQEIAAVESPDLATLSVCLRVLRNLVAQGSAYSS